MRSAISRLEARGSGIVSPVRSTSTTSFSSDSKPRLGPADQVAHHHVAVLGFELAAGFLLQILGLGGEADQQAVALLAAQFGQDIGGRIEFQREARGGLLDLLLGHLAQMKIGDRGGFDDDAGARQMLHHRLAHLDGGAHGDHFDAARRRQLHRAARPG